MALITAPITNNGVPVPAPGTAPTIRIRRADTQVLVVTDAATTTIGDGLVAFVFAQDPSLHYTIRIDADPLAAGQVTARERYLWGALGPTEADDIAADAITAAKIAASAIGSSELAADAIGAAQIAADAITAAKVAADAIGASELAADAVAEIRDSILSDSTPFAGANVDAAVSSRESETSASGRATTNQTEHDATQALISALPAPPTAAAIADAVLQEAILDHASVAGSLAEFIRIMKSLVLGNYVFDNQAYTATSFLSSGRIRCFDTAVQVAAATQGGTGEGEFATFTIAGTEHGTTVGQPQLVKVSG